MGNTSNGQMNYESARMLYQWCARQAERWVNAGLIEPGDRDVVWAKLVAGGFERLGLRVPNEVAADAIKDISVSPKIASILSKAGNGASGSSATAQSAAVVGATNAVPASLTAGAAAAQGAKGALKGGWPIAAGFFALEGAHTGYKYVKGDISGAEAGRRTVASAAVNGGGLAGAVAGAALGSAIFPGPGTVVGSLIGGVGAAFGGRKLIRKFLPAPEALQVSTK